MSALLENLVKAAETADLLRGDLREAHRAAITANQAAEVMLLEMLESETVLRRRIIRLRDALKLEGGE